MRARRRPTLILALTLVASVAAACGDSGGDDQASRDEYVEAMVASTSDDPEAVEEDNRCLAESFVDGYGVDALADDDVTPDDFADLGDPSELGLEFSDEQADDFYGRLDACLDVRHFVAAAITQGASPDQAACVEENLDDEVLQLFVVTVFAEGEAGFDQDSDVVRAITETVAPCVAAGAAGG